MRSSSKKKVVFFTGARADYTAIRPLLFSLNKSSIKFILYISGMHTVNKLGNTLKDVKKDGFKNARIIKFFKENDEQNNNNVAQFMYL